MRSSLALPYLSLLAALAVASPVAPEAPASYPIKEARQTKHLRWALEPRQNPGFPQGQPFDGKGKGAPFSGKTLNLSTPAPCTLPPAVCCLISFPLHCSS